MDFRPFIKNGKEQINILYKIAGYVNIYFAGIAYRLKKESYFESLPQACFV
jgi:hypothetical protein